MLKKVEKLERINNVLTWLLFATLIFVVAMEHIAPTLIAFALVIVRGMIEVEIIQALKREIMNMPRRY